MADDIRQLQEDFKKLNEQVRALNGSFFEEIPTSINALKNGIKFLNDELKSAKDIAGSLASSLKDSISELSKGDTNTKRIVSGFKSLESIASKFKYDMLEYSVMSKKDITNNITNDWTFIPICNTFTIFFNISMCLIYMNNNTFISNNEVVCNSLGHVLRKLYTRNINQQLPMNYHLINDINEVSPHIVDKFKLHLPNFIRLFNGLINNCLLYKKLLETFTPDEIYQMTDQKRKLKTVSSSNGKYLL
jgi:hypothetical protein